MVNYIYHLHQLFGDWLLNITIFYFLILLIGDKILSTPRLLLSFLVGKKDHMECFVIKKCWLRTGQLLYSLYCISSTSIAAASNWDIFYCWVLRVTLQNISLNNFKYFSFYYWAFHSQHYVLQSKDCKAN